MSKPIKIPFLATLALFGMCLTVGSNSVAEPVNATASQEALPETPVEPELKEGPRVAELKSMDDLKAVLELSQFVPILLYKHSTECPINARAAARLQTHLDAHERDLPKMYMVKVIETRNVSNAIAKTLGVEHESPQLLLVKDRQSIWDADHEGITADTLDKAVKEFLPEPKNDEKTER